MQTKGRLLALDVGDVRIGVAVSDENQRIALGVDYIKRIGYSKDIAAIKQYCDTYKTNTIVVGLPKLMSGVEGEQAKKTKEFAKVLEQNGFEVIFQDERLTSVSANKVLSSGSVKNKKQYVDKIAATIILQMYLDIINL